MKKRQMNNRGVTLVELMVAIAVLAMLMTAVIMLMSNNTVIYRKTKADISVQTSAQETYNAIQDSIMQAKYIEVKAYTAADATVRTYKKKSLIVPGETATGFDTLKIAGTGGTNSYTTIFPTKITVKYSVENSDDIENKNCTVSYYFCRYPDPESDKQKCNVYVTREYDASVGRNDSKWSPAAPGSTDWTPDKQVDTPASQPSKEDRDKYQDYLYTSAMTEAKMTVDYETQSFDLILDFWDRGMKYNQSGIVSCRNSYVTKDLRNRTAAAITITEGEGSSEEESSTESGE